MRAEKRQKQKTWFDRLIHHESGALLSIAVLAELITTAMMVKALLPIRVILAIHSVRVLALAIIGLTLLFKLLANRMAAKAEQRGGDRAASPSTGQRKYKKHSVSVLNVLIYGLKISIPAWMIVSTVLGIGMSVVAGGFLGIVGAAMVLVLISYGKAIYDKATQREIPRRNRRLFQRALLKNCALEFSFLAMIAAGSVLLIVGPASGPIYLLAVGLIMAEVFFRVGKILFRDGKDVFRPSQNKLFGFEGAQQKPDAATLAAEDAKDAEEATAPSPLIEPDRTAQPAVEVSAPPLRPMSAPPKLHSESPSKGEPHPGSGGATGEGTVEASKAPATPLTLADQDFPRAWTRRSTIRDQVKGLATRISLGR